jgi:hypothetical protein
MAGPAGFSKEIFNYREEVISSDLQRALALASRDLQDVIADQGRASDEGSLSSSFRGARINGYDFLATVQTVPTVQSLTIGFGQAYMQGTTGDADNSYYDVLRWPQQDVTFAAPDPTDPRIDLVVATPGLENTDNVSRNILTDPTLRTIAATAVSKTQNPLAVLTVVTGTPAGSPVPPAVPAGALALLEVYIPAGVSGTDSVNYSLARRLWRRAVYPGSTLHGILTGCLIQWTDVDEATGATMVLPSSSGTQRVAIEGEIIEWNANPPAFFEDTINPRVAAPATSDAPFYVYLCGGRVNPQASFPGGNPLVAIRSLTSPDSYGRPLASLGTPRGTVAPTDGALYIGMGFTVMGGTNIKPCVIVGDWIFARYSNTANNLTLLGFNEPSITLLDTGAVDFDFASRPGVSTLCNFLVQLATTGTPTEVISIFKNVSGGRRVIGRMFIGGIAENWVNEYAGQLLDRANPFALGQVGLAADYGPAKAVPLGYNMNVPRYNGNVSSP